MLNALGVVGCGRDFSVPLNCDCAACTTPVGPVLGIYLNLLSNVYINRRSSTIGVILSFSLLLLSHDKT